MTLQLVKDLKADLLASGCAEEASDFDPRTELDRAVVDLACMSPEEYRKVRKDKAKELRIRISELDGLVKKARKARLPAGPATFLSDYEKADEGLFYNDPTDDSRLWLCDPLEILGLSSDEGGGNQALVLKFCDGNGKEHRLSLSRADLAGEGNGFLRNLLAKGFRYNNSRRETDLLKKYLIYVQPCQKCLVISKTGWVTPSGQAWGCFAMPGTVIGDTQDRQILFDSTVLVSGWGERGTLEEWQEKIAGLAMWNSRLVFALSMAFAPPLLRFSNTDKGGFHIVGSSSTGKTTAMRLANSVWGGPSRIQTWRSTSNGSEAQAEVHNHSLHCIDELGQADAREVGQMAYMHGSGTGKARATRDGGARAVRSWESLQISTGEIGLAEHMEQGHQKVRAGQEVRLVDLQADAGKGMGIFEDLNGFITPNALATELTANAERYYGTPIRAFLKRLLEKDMQELSTRFLTEREAFLREHVPAKASGQVSRVASRFFLVAFAGELAIELGITRWCLGEAMRAAVALFDDWQRERGGVGHQEVREILDQVQGYFERYGDSRFVDCRSEFGQEESRTPLERAGYRDFVGNKTIHYVFPQVFNKQVLEGLNRKTALKVLVEAGILRPGRNNSSRTFSLGNPSVTTRVYVLENVLSPAGRREGSQLDEADGEDFFG